MPGSYTATLAFGQVAPAAAAAAPLPSASSLGAQDSASQPSLYYVEDFNQPYSTTSPQVYQAVSGTGNVAGCGTNGVVYPVAEMVKHPGVACCSTVAVGYAQFGAANGTIPIVAGSGITTTWNILFRTPDATSNSTDSYEFRVGNALAVAGTYNGPGVGAYFTDSSNSGNWQIYSQYPANEAVNLVMPNVSYSPQPGVWYNLQIVHAGGTSFSVSLNGNLMGTITDGSFVSSTIWNTSAGSMLMNRKAVGSTPPRITCLMDRASVYMNALGR